jgi:3-phosphoshikimate 1-carboxyvinyltransferase
MSTPVPASFANSLALQRPQGAIRTSVQLPASKSESNRALIINALTGNQGVLNNLSEARDTRTMQRLLESSEQTLDVIDAGTTMRFLTAFIAATDQDKILTGTPRMCERPIALLVDALRTLGANIEYLRQEGFPPIHIRGMDYNGRNHVSIRGDVSSQYVSALLMIAPLLPEGLSLELTGPVGSKPYIQMTLEQMEQFGAQTEWHGNVIRVLPKPYQPTTYSVESDWSGASYWYSIVALADDAEVELLGLKAQSLQGDSQIAHIMEPLGVHSSFTDRGVLLTKSPRKSEGSVDFTDCPDLAQTVAVCCAAQGVQLTMTGIESLKIKETDRVSALQQELSRFGAQLRETSRGTYEVTQAKFRAGTPVEIETYDDHRMAMAFAPLALKADLVIKHPNVVVKSYPRFWEDLQKAGFILGEVS